MNPIRLTGAQLDEAFSAQRLSPFSQKSEAPATSPQKTEGCDIADFDGVRPKEPQNSETWCSCHPSESLGSQLAWAVQRRGA